MLYRDTTFMGRAWSVLSVIVLLHFPSLDSEVSVGGSESELKRLTFCILILDFVFARCSDEM